MKQTNRCSNSIGIGDLLSLEHKRSRFVNQLKKLLIRGQQVPEPLLHYIASLEHALKNIREEIIYQCDSDSYIAPFERVHQEMQKYFDSIREPFLREMGDERDRLLQPLQEYWDSTRGPYEYAGEDDEYY